MNKETILRTIARVAFSIYTSFCIWQVSIGELSKLLNTPALAIVFTCIIILCGIIVDIITTYFNNDFTKIAAKHTAEMRQEKREHKEGYVGDRFFTDVIPNEYEEAEDEQEDI